MHGGTPADAWRALQAWAYRLGVLLPRRAARATTQEPLPPVRSGLLGESPLWHDDRPVLLVPPCAHQASKTRPGDMPGLTHPDTHGAVQSVRQGSHRRYDRHFPHSWLAKRMGGIGPLDDHRSDHRAV
jgi:hypothetical protein